MDRGALKRLPSDGLRRLRIRNIVTQMHELRPALLFTGLVFTMLAGALRAADGTPLPKQPQPPATCKEAVVSPVSGHAECVNPRGAPVDPPPQRPNAPARAPVANYVDAVNRWAMVRNGDVYPGEWQV